MTYNKDWDAAQEATPAGSDLRSQGDDRIREIQKNIRERVNEDHEFGDTALTSPGPSAAQITAKDTGWHRFMTMIRQASAPSNPESGYGRLYSLAADALLRFKDSSGVVKTLVDTDSTQTLDAKTLSNATLGNTTIDGIKITNKSEHYAIKRLDIGDWDMITDSLIFVAHGLTFSNILKCWVSLRNDDETFWYPIEFSSPTVGVSAGAYSLDSTNVRLQRVSSVNGGSFDSSAYNATSYNRGYITILYLL